MAITKMALVQLHVTMSVETISGIEGFGNGYPCPCRLIYELLPFSVHGD